MIREGLCEEVSQELMKSARGTFGAQPAVSLISKLSSGPPQKLLSLSGASTGLLEFVSELREISWTLYA